MAEISKSYEPADVEKSWYEAWEAAGAFAPSQGDREAYAIVIPPPNVTGVLTIGHVLNNALQDILIRRARLEGKAALWIPGTDHAGIATQAVVERELRKAGKTRRDLGRERFAERVREWRDEKGGIILKQLRRLGASCDWSRTHFTMDPEYSRAVLTVFVELFHKGRIYRGKRMVNWCPATQTALSDEEVIMKPVQGTLYRVRYELNAEPGRHIEVATTRPETIPGDVAIAVHPDDPRYAGLIGRTAWRPLCRAPIPIVGDASVDREFGSGALKITPAHDKVDFEIGQRHKLPIVDVLDAAGILNDLAGPDLAGLDRFAARKKAVELLREAGALMGEESYANNVGYSERADVPIEPRLTWQWWLRYPRVDEAKAAVKDGVIRFHPERWSKVYQNWLENIQDWCISRQLWWGHRIPVWYRKGLDPDSLSAEELADPAKVHVSVGGPADPENWVQEQDVLDTWASSWLWPFATLGWPEPRAMAQAGFDRFYPTNTLVTGPDIIFFWVARMIMAGLECLRPGEPLDRRIPFRDVYFTGIIRDAFGRKVSKSLGNSPDPLDLIAKYGADGLRFGIVSLAPQGQDIRFQEERIEGGKNFCNKLWNACRFRQMSGPPGDKASPEAIAARLDEARFDSDDHAILNRLSAVTEDVARDFQRFEFTAAIQAIYAFFWNDFCDWYVEVSKAKLAAEATKANCLAVQDFVLRQTLLLLHPFIPFITEELWHRLGYGAQGALLMRDGRIATPASLEQALHGAGIVLDRGAAAKVDWFKELVGAVRQYKASQGWAARRDIDLLITAELKLPREWDLSDLTRYLRLAGVRNFSLSPKARARVSSPPPEETGMDAGREPSAPDASEAPKGAPAVVTGNGPVYLIVPLAVDPAAEKARLGKERDKLVKFIAAAETRLGNPAFAGKAPPAVIDGARQQLAELKAKLAETGRQIRTLEEAGPVQ
ncbi:MAG: valine--tRNA ligase [Opitutaceae bacterium]